MNDTFLYLARPEPRIEFSKELFARINRQEDRWTKFWQHLRTRRGFATALIIFITLAACAQQIINSTFHHEATINGIAIYETNDLLLMDASNWLELVLNEDPLTGPLDWSTISVEQAMSKLPYSISLPEWVPAGFELHDPIYDDNSKNWDFAFSLSWWSEEHVTALVLVTHQQNGSSLEKADVFPGAWEVVDVNGTEVIFIRGNFELPFDTKEEARLYLENGGGPVEQRWNKDAGVSVLWVSEGVYYFLNPVFSPFPWLEEKDSYLVPEEDLLRIVESMIPK